jgi:hypothetical protein
MDARTCRSNSQQTPRGKEEGPHTGERAALHSSRVGSCPSSFLIGGTQESRRINNRCAVPSFHGGRQKKPRPRPGLQGHGDSLESTRRPRAYAQIGAPPRVGGTPGEARTYPSTMSIVEMIGEGRPSNAQRSVRFPQQSVRHQSTSPGPVVGMARRLLRRGGQHTSHQRDEHDGDAEEFDW